MLSGYTDRDRKERDIVRILCAMHAHADFFKLHITTIGYHYNHIMHSAVFTF
jgi:hypothetical protein